MWSDEICNILQYFSEQSKLKPRHFVLSRDQMYKIKLDRMPVLSSINADPADLPGSHWIAVYIKNKSDVRVFDSLGQPASSYHIRMPAYICITKQNFYPFQSLHSSACGRCVLYFLYYSLKGHSFRAIQNRFNPRCKINNDKIVSNFYKSLCVCASPKLKSTSCHCNQK